MAQNCRSLHQEPWFYCNGDPCLYSRWNGDSLSLISLHVDDFTISSDSDVQLAAIAKALSTKFEMTDDGELHHVLGITIERDLTKNLLFLSQKPYIHTLLERFSMSSAKAVKTPMDSLTVSSADCPLPGTDEQHAMQAVPYREACGSLMSLAINTRPDIIQCCSRVSSANGAPKKDTFTPPPNKLNIYK